MVIGLIGSGNMARALARGWGEPVLCTDSGSGRAAALAAELPERLIDAGGATSGVGPAYVALVAEAMTDAAVRRGIPAPQASELVAGCLAGTAELIARRDHDTLAIRREVASPGGTTSRGLAALERGGLRAAFHEAIDAAMEPA